jgi:hemerythrin-like domain-containing protein
MKKKPLRMSLIEELKREHKEIMDQISLISVSLSDRGDVSQLMEDLKEKCSQHLEKEDLTVYPVLKEAANSDSLLQKTLAAFLRTNHEIHGIIDSLLRDWEQNRQLDKSRIDSLLVEIWPRMLNEELFLFNEYARLRDSLQR